MNREEKRKLEKLERKAISLSNKRKRRPTIFLAYVFPRFPDMVRESWAMGSVLTSMGQATGDYGIRPVGCASGPLLSRARNTLVSSFLETSDDYMLWTDTDIIFRYDNIVRLIDLDKPIAGALYFTLDSDYNVVPVALEPGTGDLEGHHVTIAKEHLDAEEPFKVSTSGMGLTLIKREVLQALAEDVNSGDLWPFAEGLLPNGQGGGEDLIFGLRAAEKGFDWYLDPMNKVGHIKEIVL